MSIWFVLLYFCIVTGQTDLKQKKILKLYTYNRELKLSAEFYLDQINM